MEELEMIINATQHVINFKYGDKMLTFPPSGIEIRIGTTARPMFAEDDDVFVLVETGDVVGLPPRQKGIFYIVSTMVMGALPDRDDLIAPYEQVRESGNVSYCKKFSVQHSVTEETKYILWAVMSGLLNGADTPEQYLERYRQNNKEA
jgi:hypothetical protein